MFQYSFASAAQLILSSVFIGSDNGINSSFMKVKQFMGTKIPVSNDANSPKDVSAKTIQMETSKSVFIITQVWGITHTSAKR